MAIKKFNAVSGFSVGDNIIVDVIDSAANVTANNLNVTAIANLGAVGNVKITGGSANYVLKTDGAGNISWASASAVSTAAGSNTQIQFNDGGIFAGNANFTFDKTTSTLAVTGNITRDSKNVPTFVSSSTAPTDPKIGDGWYNTSNDVIYYYIYNGSTYAWVDSSSGYIGASVVATPDTIALRDGNGNLYGTHISGTRLTVDGLVSIGNVGNITITGGYTGQVLSTDGAGNLNWTTVSAGSGNSLSNGNSNITILQDSDILFTSHGNANVLTITGTGATINGVLQVSDTVTANFFVGDGYQLSNVAGANVTGIVANANYAASAYSAFAAASSIEAGQVTNPSQPNITSVGTLTGLNINGDASITGNLTVTGTTVYANVTTIKVADPIIEQGGDPSGAPLTSDDGMDRGQVLHYFSVDTQYDAFMGWHSANSEFSFAKDVIVDNNVVTISQLGNVRADYFLGNGSQLTGILADSASTALVAETVSNAAQPNITSVGTLTELTVDGITSLGSVANLRINGGSSGYILQTNGSGNVSWIAKDTGGNIAGSNSQIQFNNNGIFGASANLTYDPTYNTSGGKLTVGYAQGGLVESDEINAFTMITTEGNLYAANADLGNTAIANYFVGTIFTNAQPNITSLGQLTSLGVLGNIDAGNITSGNLITATEFSGSGVFLSNIQAGNIVGTVANANYAAYTFDVVGNNQPNITSIGTQLNLTVTANINAGNVTGANTVSANYFTGNGSLLTSITAANITGRVELANIANTVSTNAQPNITSLGTLSNLRVTGSVDLGSLSAVKIGGGLPGYTITTDGTGNLSWADMGTGGTGSVGGGFISATLDAFTGDGLTSTFTLTTTPTNFQAIVVNIDGLVQLSTAYSLTGAIVSFSSPPLAGEHIEITTYGLVSVYGNSGEVQFNDSGAFSSANSFTFNKVSNTLSVSGNMVANNFVANSNVVISGGSLTIDTGIIAVSGNAAGIFTTGVANLNIGLLSNVTLGSTTGNVTARGNLIANNISTVGNVTANVGNLTTMNAGNAVVSSTLAVTNLKVNDFFSNRAPVTVTSSTIIDEFPASKYRTAKYTIKVGSDDGYQSVEALLIHNGASAFVTIYGSISTIGTDIVLLSATVDSGNVQILATSGSANTTVNLLGTYVAD